MRTFPSASFSVTKRLATSMSWTVAVMVTTLAAATLGGAGLSAAVALNEDQHRGRAKDH
jgi:hypothetical protein